MKRPPPIPQGTLRTSLFLCKLVAVLFTAGIAVSVGRYVIVPQLALPIVEWFLSDDGRPSIPRNQDPDENQKQATSKPASQPASPPIEAEHEPFPKEKWVAKMSLFGRTIEITPSGFLIGGVGLVVLVILLFKARKWRLQRTKRRAPARAARGATEKKSWSKWFVEESKNIKWEWLSYLIPIGLYLLFILILATLIPTAWAGWRSWGEVFFWTTVIGGAILLMAILGDRWFIRLVLLAILIVLLLYIDGPARFRKAWYGETTAAEMAAVAQKAEKWTLTFFMDQKEESIHKDVTLEVSGGNLKCKYKANSGSGTIVARYYTDGLWRGKWVQPGSWGEIQLSKDCSGLQWTGYWRAQECGTYGGLQIARQ